MDIVLENVGKKFNRNWIFRHINYQFSFKSSTSITGPNGIGKSTLLKILGNYTDPSQGTVSYLDSVDKNENPQLAFSFVAPYLNLIEEFTLLEHLNFHFHFKHSDMSAEEMLSTAGLSGAKNRKVSELSSGMKQRLRLMMAFNDNSKVLLLDEPTSNLDESGIDWYQNEINSNLGAKTIIIASNQRYEYEQITANLDLLEYLYPLS